MVERPMPQDVMKFKAKLMGNFTARQAVWGAIGVGICLGCYFWFGKGLNMNNQMKIIISAIPALPFFMIGFVPIMGMPMEKVIVPVVVDNFIAPAIRKKEIHNPEFEKYMKAHFGEYEFKVTEPVDEKTSKSSKSTKSKTKVTKGKAKSSLSGSKYVCKKSPEFPGIK